MTRTKDSIPYAVPEVIPLLKAKTARPKDAADFSDALLHMRSDARTWLADALDLDYPGHQWLAALE